MSKFTSKALLLGLSVCVASPAMAQTSQSDPDHLTDKMTPVGNSSIPNDFMKQSTPLDSTPSIKKSSADSVSASVSNPGIPDSAPASLKNNDNDFRPAPPDIAPAQNANTDNTLNPRGSINIDDRGSSLDTGDTGGNGQNGTTGGLVALPDRSRENPDAELDEALRHAMVPPNVIRQERIHRDDLERAGAEPLSAYKPVVRAITLTLRPGEMPPVIHLAYGTVTSLTFSDVTGAPWYVGRVVTDSSAYTTTQGNASDSTRSNIITLAPVSRYSSGRNATVMLEHLSLPVIMQLDTGMDTHTVDYRVDIQILQRGPNARADFVADGLAPAQDADMQTFVDGISPQGAKALKTSNPAVEAWKYKGQFFIRTSMHLLAPAWIKKSSSNLSGESVYVTRPTPNLTVAIDGEPSAVMIEY